MPKKQRPTEWDAMRPNVLLAEKQLCELAGLNYYHPEDARWIAECVKAGDYTGDDTFMHASNLFALSHAPNACSEVSVDVK